MRNALWQAKPDLVSKVVWVSNIPGCPVAVCLHSKLPAKDRGPCLGSRPRNTKDTIMVSIVDQCPHTFSNESDPVSPHQDLASIMQNHWLLNTGWEEEVLQNSISMYKDLWRCSKQNAAPICKDWIRHPHDVLRHERSQGLWSELCLLTALDVASVQRDDVKYVIVIGKASVANVENSSTRLRLACMNCTANIPEVEPVIDCPAEACNPHHDCLDQC